MQKKFFRYAVTLGVLPLLLLGSLEAMAQQAPADVSAPDQTLFQETTEIAPAEQKQAPTPTKASEDTPSLSLQEYLNQRDAGSANPSTPTSPGMDLQSNTGVNGTPQKSPEVLKSEEDNALRKEAFQAMKGQLMPLNPSEIRRILEMYDETTQAAETPIYPDPDMISSFKRASLDPGSKPLVIKTAIGHVTTLSIVDMTGQPWPIQDLTWAGNFQIEQPDKGSHMLRITPTSEFASGNVSMRLIGLNPPVIFSLKAERKTVDVRLDVQIPEIGPNGVMPPVETPVMTKAGDDFLAGVLMGVVSGKDTSRLQVDGIDGRTTAYAKGDMMYIRTPYTMLSPAWTQSIQSGDGMKVYALNFSPVVLLSDKGKMVRAYFSHKEQADEQY